MRPSSAARCPLASAAPATRRLVSDTRLAGVTGKFFDRTREVVANAQAYDPDARRELWRRSLDLIGHSGAI